MTQVTYLRLFVGCLETGILEGKVVAWPPDILFCLAISSTELSLDDLRGGRKEGREGGKEGRRKGEREGEWEGEREGEREEGGREKKGRDEKEKGGREGEREAQLTKVRLEAEPKNVSQCLLSVGNHLYIIINYEVIMEYGIINMKISAACSTCMCCTCAHTN